MNQSIEKQCDSLAVAITESLHYLRKICDKSSTNTTNAKAAIEHCIAFEHCDVEININFKAKSHILGSNIFSSQS